MCRVADPPAIRREYTRGYGLSRDKNINYFNGSAPRHWTLTSTWSTARPRAVKMESVPRDTRSRRYEKIALRSRDESKNLGIGRNLGIAALLPYRHFLTALETKAEVNPVIRHLFKQLYDIDLPDSVEPTRQGIDDFHAHLNARIQAGDPSVTLTKVDKPRIDVIHEKAKRRLDQFRRNARMKPRRERGKTSAAFVSCSPGNRVN